MIPLKTLRMDLESRIELNKGLEDRMAMVLLRRCEALEAAITKHRDQRGDDRCWIDDGELYAAIGDPALANTALPPKEIFLANCARFHASRENPRDSYVTVEQLVREERERVIEAVVKVHAGFKASRRREEFDEADIRSAVS